MKLHNTLTRKIEDFIPLSGNQVSIYTCGLTVYGQPHIGNWVSYIYWDVLQRYLESEGYDVNRVQNITDVGHLVSDEDAGQDKMEKGAKAEGVTAWDIAKKYTQLADDEAYNQLKLQRPTHMPKATDYIQQQIDFVKELEDKGFTYSIDDGVYFDTSKLSDYGKLSNLNASGLRPGIRVEDTGKKHPTDFALWKFSPIGEKRDMEWESPWGKGFPGWHLECSVMARELLGDQIDIHTGGIDHIPIHHTNEIAQTEAVTSKQFSQFWVHANHIKVNGTKMSKSLGNIYTLDDIKKRGVMPDAFKLLVLSKHYRTEGNFTWDILSAAQKSLHSIQVWADLRFQKLTSPDNEKTNLEAIHKFRSALAEDLHTPNALSVLFEAINKSGENGADSKSISTFVNEIDALFGFGLGQSKDISDSDKKAIIARENVRLDKNWKESDIIRDDLLKKGVVLNDSPQGTRWERLSN